LNRLHLNRHGKLVAVLLAVVLAWGGFSLLTAEPAQSDAGATQVASYIVRPGDTLWSYASSVTPAGQDVAQTVDELISLNDLESGSLQAGQRIIVPAE
jgi:LysM repeat protein